MAKSVLHAAVGILVGDGRLDLDAPAPVPAWAGDERSAITLDHLLAMRDGLAFAEDYEDAERSDVIEMLFGSGQHDVAAYAESRPLAHPPGEVFNYSSGTSNIVAAIVGRTVGRGHDDRRVPPRASVRTDRHDLGRAAARRGRHLRRARRTCTRRRSDYARFGLLYLRDGVWDGRRLLPEGWVDHARRHRSTDPVDGRGHGSHWWVEIDDPLGGVPGVGLRRPVDPLRPRPRPRRRAPREVARRAVRPPRRLAGRGRLPVPAVSDRYGPRAVVVLGPQGLHRDDVVAVARHGAAVELSPEAVAAMAATRAHVDAVTASEEPAYGISTGFGGLATTFIPAEQRARLQRSLIASHAAGMGEPVETEVVRAMVLLRARTLATGITGARPELAAALLDLLANGPLPEVPEFGSLGCSGDLAPLAHVATGPRPRAGRQGGARPRQRDRRHARHARPRLRRPAGAAARRRHRRRDERRGPARHRPRLRARPRRPPARIRASRRRPPTSPRCSPGRPIVASHRTGDPRVQDAYSLRCAPQVHGAARDALTFAESCADRELAAAIDNPVVLADGRVESVGNFHGAPLAHACDLLAIVVADVASMSERRTDRFLDPARSHGLPPFLADEPGVDSGLMIAQYTAAALVAECRRLAVPASTDSIPTSAMQEDHVSMGWAAARKLRVATRPARPRRSPSSW